MSYGKQNWKPIEYALINYMSTFKVQGQIYRRAGLLLPPPDKDHKFLQIYFMGNTDEQIDLRSRFNTLDDKLSLYYKFYSINTTNEFKRLQFPVLFAFAMTINKAQGQ